MLLEVAAVGVCGSDLHQWTAEHTWPVNYPVVLGHEFAGVVVEIGRASDRLEPGRPRRQRNAAIIDPDSPLSRQGLYNLDPEPQRLRLRRRWGHDPICQRASPLLAPGAG